ncbi:dipeptidyl aminopeptidase [Leptospira hartskeerlii]|uniref:Dipeptidyl aminopeptidase n=1 Tax=Leptospira hartskeerlii TaxID=2023177 RepID=A0A2M9XH69_9LEPT|nr:alpha/beta hydrolase [Leptospira hartskeerlii]PJZ27010.1 dipeptidyl aminopeptidase [Leptospira hartskeerlii]PJZ33669.1 dipeptidyl aminopeptidase [Leptospira hartskeerlii]
MKRILLWSISIILLLVPIFVSFGIWSASNQLLFPVWRDNQDFSACNSETEKHWGPFCGNLRNSNEFKFEELKIPSSNGFDLPAWKVSTLENGKGKSKGVIFLVHGGGSDKREMTKHIRFFLKSGLDVFSFDFGCHGEASCTIPGLSYGYRESKDVLSVYRYLSERYDKIYALGSSVGASSILISLPEMPKLSGVIAENPMYNFERLIMEFPGTTKDIPALFSYILIKLTQFRGKFETIPSPASSLANVNYVPILFIHSKEDQVVSFQQSQDLANLYKGPKEIWFPEKGEHGTARDVNPNEYEKRVSAFLDGLK